MKYTEDNKYKEICITNHSLESEVKGASKLYEPQNFEYMYKTETHAHTYPISTCSKIEPREMVRLYKAIGYDTIFISNHFSPHHFDKWGKDMTFSERVDKFYDAFLEAADEGEKIGLSVLFSAEYTLNNNHYLLYGISKEFLKKREDIFEISIEEFSKYAKSQGITVVQAHPCIKEKCKPYPHYVNGFEGINTSTRSDKHNDISMKIAKENNLPISCGSDAHEREDIGRSAMLSEEKITSVEQYLKLMLTGKLMLFANGTIVCDSRGKIID